MIALGCCSEVDTGTCTITTKNLDGETNLKSKSAVGYSHRLLIEQLPTDSRVSDEETGQTSSIDIEASGEFDSLHIVLFSDLNI